MEKKCPKILKGLTALPNDIVKLLDGKFYEPIALKSYEKKEW